MAVLCPEQLTIPGQVQSKGPGPCSGQDGDRALMSAREARDVLYGQERTMGSPVSNPGGLQCETVDPFPQECWKEEEGGVGKLRRLLTPDAPRTLAAKDSVSKGKARRSPDRR